MEQRVSAKQLRQQLSVAPLKDRIAIREQLFAMAETDPDVCIETMHLWGMYSDEQREDYYRTKQWCEENDAENE